jgi:hypothetical protein
MARPELLPPRVASLTESLRDLGYSLEAAVADLIDNSISADATEIEIFCDLARSTPVVVIADNGKGMTEPELIAAMQYGSTDPRTERQPKDLGRFGLGLKTASFSQCRRLTVVSAKDGQKSAAQWDLDLIEEKDGWIVLVLDHSEIAGLPYVETLGESGTLVIWQELDRLFEDVTGGHRDQLVAQKLGAVERHLSLVFHRFLSGEIRGRKRLSINLNRSPVNAFDPFCRQNEATQRLPEEIVRVGDVAVSMQPYILPHHSRLTASDYDFYQSRSDFISNQGAYIYRNGRLMAWGDWFRLVPKGESTKLVRIQIDFPNCLDEAWTIDIKKSRARPPHAVRERLRQLIDRIIVRGHNIYRGRGQKLFQEVSAPLWERYSSHEGIRYAVNADHPLVEAIRTALPEDSRKYLDLLAQSLSAALPVEMIYSDYSTHPRDFSTAEAGSEVIRDRLKRLKDAVFTDGVGDPETFRQIARSTRLFDSHADLVEQFIREELA